jgi:hypothetical protein
MASIDFSKALGNLDANSEMIREYWRDLRESWQASENSLRRTLFYIVALATAFLLLHTKAIDRISFLGLEVINLRLVATLIPAVIGYLIYVVSTNAAIAFTLGEIHSGLAKHYWPNFYSADLELTVMPAGAYAENALVSNGLENNFLGGVASWAGITRFLISMFAPIVFDVYALEQLFAQRGGILWLECVVTAVSFFMILASAPNLIYIFTKQFDL